MLKLISLVRFGSQTLRRIHSQPAESVGPPPTPRDGGRGEGEGGRDRGRTRVQAGIYILFNTGLPLSNTCISPE